MITETKVVVKYSSCGGRRLPVQMGPQRNQETMRDCRDCHKVNVMSQCCPSPRLFNELWNVIVPWWVSWTTMIPDTKKCGGGRLHWLSLRPRTTPPWHCHSDYQFLPTPVTYGVPLPSIPSLGRPALVPTGDHGTIPKSASKLDTELRSFPQGRSPRARRPAPLRVSGMMMLALEVSCFMWICGPFNGLWTDHCNWDGQPSDCDENINKCILSESQPELCTNWLLKMATTNSNKGENYVKWQIKMDQ